MDKKRIKASNIQTSISSVIGSATSFYINWLKSKFPKGFIKETYVSGMLTSIETERKDIIKKSKPLLIVRPEYAGENGFMETLPYWHNTLQYVFNSSDKYYTPVFKDPDKNISIHAIPDRIKIDVPTKLLVSTKVYGINLLHYMKNIIEPGGHGFINQVYFENELPASFVNIIFDTVFNTEAKQFNNEINNKVKEIEKILYVKEVTVIEYLKEISKLSNIHDEEGKITKEESARILELNILVSNINRDIKKLKQQIDELRKECKPVLSLADPDESIRMENMKLLEEYFNKFANTNIVCRRNTSTGNFEFAFKNRCNILMHMDSLPSLDSVKKGRTEDYAVISFEISLDFNTNSNFILEIGEECCPDSEIEEDFNFGENKYQFNIYFEEDVPKFILDEDRYYLLRNKQKFICDFNVDIDTLDFSSLLDSQSRDTYDNILAGDYMDLFRIKLFMGGTQVHSDDNSTYWQKKELIENIDYRIDWKNKKINIIKPIGNVNYLFALYTNQYRLNMDSMEKEHYQKVKLLGVDYDKFILLSDNGDRFSLSIESTGVIRTDLFTLDSKVRPIRNCQLKSKNGKLFNLKVDKEGILYTEETTKVLNILNLEDSKFKIEIDDNGILSTTMKIL